MINPPGSDSFARRWPLALSTYLVIVVAAVSLADDTLSGAAGSAAELEFFEKKVRPLLVEHCYACHSAQADKVQAGLRVDGRDAVLQGGDSGAAVIPGNADDSLLVQAVRYEGYEMPPRGKLSEAEIETLVRWVEQGAVWPLETQALAATTQAPQFDLQQRAREHWAWQPIATPDLPQVDDATWPRDELDHFVLARLEAAGLRPAPDADRFALLRRLYFDLVGLPPTPAQVSEFLSDPSPVAVHQVVDQLLQSPHFGERWGRHWLDLVRYAESRGHEFDDDAENAYQYRDYVIRALNADVAYDQLVREHIAGDLLAHPRLNPAAGFNESILGTGFWFLGEWVHSPVDIRKDEADRFDNMIDVMSKAFLGLTVACARCHDHKFDAISTADYYALCGFLQSSDFRQVRFESLEHNRAIAQELADLDARYRQALEQLLCRAGLPQSDPGLSSSAGQAAIVVDYAALPADGFLQDGYAFGPGPGRAGELILASTAGSLPQLACRPRSEAVNDPFWNGLRSVSQPAEAHSRSALAKIPRSGRTLRTPTFTLEHPQLACRVEGAGHVVACVDSHRLVAGPLHAETVVKIEPEHQWVHLNLGRYVGHRLHLEFTPDQDRQLAVACVMQDPTEETRRAVELRQIEQQNWALARQQAIEGILDQNPQLARETQTIVSDWSQQREALLRRVKTHSRLAMAMLDGTGEDDRILIRGNASNPGRVEPRHFLTALPSTRPLTAARGSGRLELAEQINDPTNPLASRVIVNRLWHHLLGRGIVPTTDDFGVLGQPPSHPPLLDYLALRFLREGRSIKKTIRAIVLSRTYQMSGRFSERAMQLDPQNDLWHYRPPKRLEGEAIRDSLLAISGQLDRTQFGPSVPVHLTAFMDGRGRPETSGPLDGAGRRTIYIAVRRNFLSPFLTAFDMPSPFSTMGRRNSSNVPAQALILMNDPFVIAQTQHWARRGLEMHPIETAHSERSKEQLIGWLYLSGLGRPPAAAESEAALAFLDQQAAQQKSVDGAWRDLAHALVNTKEFIFLR